MDHLPLKELLLKIADDQLILGHRNSEWTGLGPLLEEDIAFSSMAQDKIGQSLALFQMLHQLGEPNPDTNAFLRPATEFHNCILTELPNGEYDFSLIRHFLFDTAEAIRFELLSVSSYEPLAQLARKIRGELRYHTLHARTWMQQLGTATPESVSRLQNSLTIALPYALGIFEESPFETELIASGLFAGEQAIKTKWTKAIEVIVSKTQLKLPPWNSIVPVMGGRKGHHSEHLQALLDEMGEVFRTDPESEW
jgi:ring-1,2-phenylacetyl-CoA epoxidase subunit PaaC